MGGGGTAAVGAALAKVVMRARRGEWRRHLSTVGEPEFQKMAVGAGLKTSLRSKVKVSAGRFDATGNGTRIIDGKKKHGRRNSVKKKSKWYGSDEAESDSEPYQRNRKDESVESSLEIDGTKSTNRYKGRKSGETSADKLRLKGKKIDGTVSTNRHKGYAEDEVLGKDGKSKEKSNQIAEKKQIRLQTRVLNKTGKKTRINRKASGDGSAESGAPPQKRKRVIKIDPYDISNKRLDDTIPNNGRYFQSSIENVVEKKTEMSKNAQFRAIQPSPSILSFVEDNLLGRRRLNELQNAGYNIKLSAPLDNILFSTSKERERIEESVFRNKLEFFAAAKISSSFPPPMIPEIAFSGRSNVGKSSLLNALTRQWGVVRTSDKPGLTQTINFFKLASKLCLVDLPGYGFAYAKDEVKEAWEELVKEYVSTRVGLQRVCLLIDTKWGMKPRDHELIDLMEKSQTPYQIVLTKTDIVFPIDVARRAMQIQEDLKKNKSVVNPVMMVSSKSGAGIRSLRTVLANLARFIKP
ncbi:hypothetical protein COCNU_04G004310 [Cocos nucifera]|uniref:EngB-type G domain-containing protein n=1 Tax=Cocos nucifera TaxID=13894 RepID=A0A8K0I546_COCNU|nr:hypothetical protein COCNU_04G004310 [Cocos nucifera]